MSRMLSKMNLISVVQQLPKEDIETIQGYVEMIEVENQKYKEVIDKAIKRLEQGITFCQNDSQGSYDICNISIQREEKILDILKEVK